MYKILHIFTDNKFFYDADKFVNQKFHSEILYIGSSTEETIARLKKSPFEYKILENTPNGVNMMIHHANKFDGIIFYSISEPGVEMLFRINSNVKTFLRFFGWELYGFYIEKFLSEKTLALHPEKQKQTIKGVIGEIKSKFKRKIKILLNKEYSVKLDIQKKVYKKLDAVMMINEFEYSELRELFYLPKLIKIGLTTHPYTRDEIFLNAQRTNTIILGNSGANVNNHIDVLDIINASNYKDSIKFYMFFSYANVDAYAQNIKAIAKKTKDVVLLEDFLAKEEFESMYLTASALIINSTRQHATANIFIAIKNGCKVYLNKKSSTYKWFIANGLLISDVDTDLKRDLETGNFKLSIEEQQINADAFLKIVNDYTVDDFLNQVISVLNK